MAKKGDFWKDLFSDLIFSNIVDFVKNIINNIQESIHKTTKKILHSVIATAVMIMGLAMIVIAIPFLLAHYLDLPASLFFVLIGIILIFISLFAFDRIR